MESSPTGQSGGTFTAASVEGSTSGSQVDVVKNTSSHTTNTVSTTIAGTNNNSSSGSAAASSSVRVAVRVRPLIGREKVNHCDECIQVLESEKQILIGKDRAFTYDYVFSKYNPQGDLWQCVQPLVNSFFEGYNATIFAYGQTGSGKTYSMGSGSNLTVPEDELGIIPRVISHVFEETARKATEKPGYKAEFKMRFLEIYGEDIHDLIHAESGTVGTKVTIRETEAGQIQVHGATEEPIFTADDFMQILERGTMCRTTGSTLMNTHSSRSHAILTLSMSQSIPIEMSAESTLNEGTPSEGTASEGTPNEGTAQVDAEIRQCYFHFVDLAGSERQKRTQAEGKRLKEGIDINKGLLALGNVISALGDEKKRGKVHIPYRDSKLTRMLQDSLGGNSRTVMITCVSPADVNFEETLNALKYANRARNIRNKAVVNRDNSSTSVIHLRKQLQLLQSEVLRLRRGAAAAATATAGSDGAGLNSSDVLDNTLFSSLASEDQFRSRAEVAEAEVQRLSSEMKRKNLEMERLKELMISAQTDRDYFRILVEDSTVDDGGGNVDGEQDRERQKKRDVIQEYLSEIAELKSKLVAAEANAQSRVETRASAQRGPLLGSSSSVLSSAEAVASTEQLMARAKEELRREHERLEKLESEMATAAEKQEGQQCDLDVEMEMDVDVEMDEDEVAEEVEKQRIFEQRQQNLGAEVTDLSNSIQLKEQLIEDLHRARQGYDRMKGHYEQKMAELAEEVRVGQQDREKLLAEIHALEKGGAGPGLSAVADRKRLDLAKELKEKERRLADGRRKIREMERHLASRAKADERLRNMVRDLSHMKQQKVSLVKKMAAERKEFEREAVARRREIMSLKRRSQKDRDELKKLGARKEMSDRVMKRRMEEMTAVNKRLRNQQRSRIVLTKEEKRKQEWLARQIKKVAAKEEKHHKLDEELKKREKIVKQMEELYGQRSKLQQKAATPLKPTRTLRYETCSSGNDASTMSTTTSTSTSTSSLSKSSIRNMLISPLKMAPGSRASSDGPQTPPRRPLSEEEEQTMFELEERIEACQAQLEYKDDRISDLAKDVHEEDDDDDDNDDEEDDDDDEGDEKEEKVSTGGLSLSNVEKASLPEARTLLKILFNMAVASRKSEQKKQTSMEEKKLQMSELKDKLNEVTAWNVRMRQNYEDQIARLRRDHSQKLSQIIIEQQALNRTTSTDDNSNERQTTSDDGQHNDVDVRLVSKSPPSGSSPNGSPPNGSSPNGSPPNGSPPSGSPPSGSPPAGSPSSRTKILLKIAEERNNALRKQCDELENQRVQLEHKYTTAEEKMRKERTRIESYAKHIQWLEQQLDEKENSTTRFNNTHTSISSSSPSSVYSSFTSPTQKHHRNKDLSNPSPDMQAAGEISPATAAATLPPPAPTTTSYHASGSSSCADVKNIFHRLASPNNFTGIHKQRMKDNVKKKEEMKIRGDRTRAPRRVRDKLNPSAISATPSHSQSMNNILRPCSAPAGSSRPSMAASSSSKTKIPKLSSVAVPVSALRSRDAKMRAPSIETVTRQRRKSNQLGSSSPNISGGSPMGSSSAGFSATHPSPNNSAATPNSPVVCDTTQSVVSDSGAEPEPRPDVYTRLAGQYTASSKSKRQVSNSPSQRDVGTKSPEKNPNSPCLQPGSSPAWPRPVHRRSISDGDETLKKWIQSDGGKNLEAELKDPLLGADRLVDRVHNDIKERLNAARSRRSMPPSDDEEEEDEDDIDEIDETLDSKFTSLQI